MCMMCDGASRDEALFDLHAKVLRHGWALQAVGGHDEPGVDRVYTVGLSSGFDHPELVYVGDLAIAAPLLNGLGELVRDGRRFEPGDEQPVAGGLVGIGAVHPRHLEGGLIAQGERYLSSIGVPSPPRVLQVIPPETCCAACRAVPRLSSPTAQPRRRTEVPRPTAGDGGRPKRRGTKRPRNGRPRSTGR